MKEALDLLAFINKELPQPISVSFIERSGDRLFYEISGSGLTWSVTHCSTPESPRAAFAVGRIAQITYGIKFLIPQSFGLKVGAYVNTSARIFDSTPSRAWVQNSQKLERLWFWFHGVSLVVPGFHESTFTGMALKHPELAVKLIAGSITETTKLDLTKADAILPILLADYRSKGSKKYYNLWAPDDINESINYFDIPNDPRLTDYDKGQFQLSVQKAQPMGLNTNRTSQFYKDNIREWLPFDDADRLILTDLYLQFWVKVDQYFIANGATCRFRIFAYSTYYCFRTEGKKYDLSNFDLYYVTKGLHELTTASIAQDAVNWDAWEETGAHMAFRPNLLFAFPLVPYTQAHNWTRLIKKYRDHEFVIDGFSSRLWFSYWFNYYTVVRMQAGLTFTAASEEWFKAIGLQTRLAAFYKIVKAISVRPVDLPNKMKYSDLAAIPYKYTEADFIALENALGPESDKESYLFKWIRAGFGLSKMAYLVSTSKMQPEAFYIACEEANKQYPGLYGSITMIKTLVEGSIKSVI